VDLGSGATVCQPASGCRLTGDFCLEVNQCCGGGVNPNGSVQCAGTVSTRCDNGQACNPVGNICGAPVLPDGGSINASQNCCDGKKEVCKVDSSGIPRCFGGCPSGDCTGGPCPTGYDPGNPSCCIQPGHACQFKDQCCNRLPCVPSADGGFVCSDQGSSCTPLGAACTAAADGGASACCAGAVCLASSEGSAVCQLPGGGPDGGTADGGTADGGADGGVDGGAGCKANASPCASGAECCSNVCTSGRCAPPAVCQPQSAACTSAADCCAGLFCSVPAGQTSGTCQPGSTCGSAGQQCSVGTDGGVSACCPGLFCDKQGTFTPCDGTTVCTCVFRPL
jgi:hypothetical protein